MTYEQFNYWFPLLGTSAAMIISLAAILLSLLAERRFDRAERLRQQELRWNSSNGLNIIVYPDENARRQAS